MGGKNEKTDETRENETRKRPSENCLDQRLKSEVSLHLVTIFGPGVPPQRQCAWQRRGSRGDDRTQRRMDKVGMEDNEGEEE